MKEISNALPSADDACLANLLRVVYKCLAEQHYSDFEVLIPILDHSLDSENASVGLDAFFCLVKMNDRKLDKLDIKKLVRRGLVLVSDLTEFVQVCAADFIVKQNVVLVDMIDEAITVFLEHAVTPTKASTSVARLLIRQARRKKFVPPPDSNNRLLQLTEFKDAL